MTPVPASASNAPARAASLDAGVAYARERGLLPLLADLRIARAMAAAATAPQAAAEDFAQAVAYADRAGAARTAGRARLQWALRVPGAPRRELLRRALVDLLEDAPLGARAAAAR